MKRRLDFQRIRQRLTEKNLSLDKLKWEAGIDPRTLERLMSGKTQNAQTATVKAIADFLELEPSEILLSAAPPSPPSSPPSPPSSPPSLHEAPYVEVHLPVTGKYLIGREEEIEQLDLAWSQDKIKLFTVAAWGGAGKSALVTHWLGQLASNNWRGAERVFGWTFHSQGVRDGMASADGFINAALRFFGDTVRSAGNPWEKGNRLAHLIREKRTLLLLDGLEPLQYPPGPNEGRLKDPALAVLLTSLALQNPGLCVITTRIAIADVASFQSTTTPILHLDDLSEQSGAKLLHALGVRGTDSERRAAAQEFGGHALALHLLGTYLRDACGGDVHRRRELELLDDWSEQNSPAWRLMESYERWFGHGPEVAVLRLLGLFDRMATVAEVEALRAEPVVDGLNDRLINLTERQWVQALRRLRTAGLLAPAAPRMPHGLDAHPLIREYYRHKLREHHVAAWHTGHARLYRHLQAMVTEERPTTMDTLLPLYSAVNHGCLAGQHQEALDIFRHRIRHGEHKFSLVQLGAFGADLSILSNFFDTTWSTVIPELSDDDRLFLFQAAGEYLNALGRIFEAEEPLHKALELAQEMSNWSMAASASITLSEVYRASGDLQNALRSAQNSAKYIAHAGVPVEVQLGSYAYLGFIQHWVGKSGEAKRSFRKAEDIQQESNPQRPTLHAILGYMYGEVLLDDLAARAPRLTWQNLHREWLSLYKRTMSTLALSEQDGVLCDLGLQHVSMGRVYLLGWQCHAVKPDSERWPDMLHQAHDHLNLAVDCIRRSNHWNYVPRALLTRATLYRLQNQFHLAHDDIDDVLNIAHNHAMDFYKADTFLELAYLHLAAYDVERSQDQLDFAICHLDQCKILVEKMNYHRRDRQILELDIEIQNRLQH